MYKKILVPVDGSKLAERSLSYAEEFGSRCGSEITLIQVVEEGDPRITVFKEDTTILASGARRYLDEVANDLNNRSISTKSVVGVGNSAAEIVDYANKEKIDLILMATHGRSGIKRWALGSVAAKVLRKSTTPVFLVPANIPDDISYRHWSLGTILVPLDGSPLAEGILPHIEVLAKHGGNGPIEVVLVQVCEPPFITADYPEASMPLTWEQHVEHIESTFKRKAEEYLQEVETQLKTKNVTVRSEVLMGKPADQIIEYAQKNGIGLTAMSTHGYSGITRWASGSVADKVLHRIHVPIFLVRPQK